MTRSAREALSLLLLPGDGEAIRSISYFNTMEIYPGERPSTLPLRSVY